MYFQHGVVASDSELNFIKPTKNKSAIFKINIIDNTAEENKNKQHDLLFYISISINRSRQPCWFKAVIVFLCLTGSKLRLKDFTNK